MEARIKYQDYLIHSQMTDRTYGSIDDYMLSAEHYFWRDDKISQYKKSLYEEHQLNATRVVSNSIHYKAVYAVADYHVGSYQTVDAFNIYNYELVGGSGNLGGEAVEYRQKRDAVVAWAAYAASQIEVMDVPGNLLGKGVTQSVNNRQEAIRYAAILTCFAGKIRIR